MADRIIFGDGIDWDFHIQQVFEVGEENVYYKYNSEMWIFKLIGTYIKTGKLLDCGSHVGRWCRAFREMGFEYTGIDQSPQVLEVAKKYNPDYDFRNIFLWDMNFDNEFDIATFIAVLQHNKLDEKERILARVNKALKMGGYCLIAESTINADNTTQLCTESWINLFKKYGFEFLESVHENELGFKDCFLFRKTEEKGE